MTGLTEQQEKLHKYLCDRWNDPPTVREIAAFMGGIGNNAVVGHLKALEKKGYIEGPDDRRSRGIRLLEARLDGKEITIAGRLYRLVEIEAV